MSAPRKIPEAITAVQTAAADPAVSAFVAANAGSGKTHVLAQRVIRLLLAGVDPARILCITFTKAAAANMADRVFSQLAGWISLDDAALDAKLLALGVKTVSAGQRERARKLFAAALDAPGGLKVETIHAFCTRLLQRFPFEAEVPAQFSVLDDRATDELLDRATLSVLLEATATPESVLGQALADALACAADTTLRDLLRETVFRRHALSAWFAASGGLAGALEKLSETLGVAPGETAATIEKSIVESPLLPASEWKAVAAVYTGGSKTDVEKADCLLEALATSGPSRIDAYSRVFLTEKGTPRKTLLTSALAKKHPAVAQRLEAEKDRLVALQARRQAAACRDRTAALLTLAEAVIKKISTEKARRGLLDYDDLIDKTLDLLAHTAPGWVHYKLDRAIDHVLIDEAQDTSPKQWEIVRQLVAEFTAGEGARPGRRSIFAVGDEKQSIFSFQGAAPKEFARNRRFFQTAHRAAGLPFLATEFKFSFRSGANVLGAVDAVFSGPGMAASITSDAAGIPPHEALPDAAPGVVELWPLMPPDPVDEIEGWDAPFDAVVETSPQVKLAGRIARTIRDTIASGEPAGSTSRPLRAGDVLVLVRQRGKMFEAIIRALKEAGVPVAGADRLTLTEHVAVIDLMALADALLLPEDDLALAIALKSPLLGFDDDLLFRLAWRRPGSLHAALMDAADEDPAFAAAAACFARCAEVARRERPFGFFSWLLGAEGGRARILARLGLEANDALDEFLSLALDYERAETPSLQGFVAWLRAAETEIKRDMEISRDEVRVMTVHGAKGLEAPLVFLADTTQPPAGPRAPRLLPVPIAGAPPGAAEGIVWAGRKDGDPAAVGAARQQASAEAEDEYRRLLYVAMTRAAHRLVVCGCKGARTPPAGCWHELIERTFAGGPAVTEDEREGFDEPVRIFRKVADVPAVVAAASEEPPPAPEPPEPGWLRTPLAAGWSGAGERAPGPLAPSVADTARPVRPRSAEAAEALAAARKTAIARGVLVHRLLQTLPDLPAARRAAAAADFLALRATDLTTAECEKLAAEIVALLADSRLAPLFGPGSRAEVPIVGRLPAAPGGPIRVVSGRVDRLAITPEAVLIADFKTNRPAPKTAAAAPPAYVAQLALYRAVLARIYPDHPVRALLVWTDGPDPMELSADLLDAALARMAGLP
ncbi:ATP-dependent nuclease subunit A [Rhodovulum sp. PH10]|uniref:double-strand break repair helicase AddA n=1 Tax=Rhodovulum sp. PH10 TaxID=1187851 RepID=UPI00027C2711|nr:double-strand break repair helicase AddA [Rhodovulum sp. PH10]EJW13657.1 ATP-dependent nuclease subunit A [Rhodovulum sp. PH10]